MADGGPAAVVGCGFLDAVDQHDRCDREAPRRQRLVPLSAHVWAKAHNHRRGTRYCEISRVAVAW